jgi:hypothetical protein
MRDTPGLRALSEAKREMPRGRHGRRLCSDCLLQRASGCPSVLFEQYGELIL